MVADLQILLKREAADATRRDDSPLQHGGYPKQEICSDFIRINLIQHLMPPAGIEMMRDVRGACATIATHEDPKAPQLLAHGVFAAGK